jgi:hypothetical protein
MDVRASVPDIVSACTITVGQLGVIQSADRVVNIKEILGAAGRLDVGLLQWKAERERDRMRQPGLARSRVALQKQRAAQRDGEIDRVLQLGGGEVWFALDY